MPRKPERRLRLSFAPACVLIWGMATLVFCSIGVKAGEQRHWEGVRTWLYQLQNIDLERVRNSGFDLVVMDAFDTPRETGMFTREELDAAREGRRGSRLLVAYLSIGEAEAYRYYWREDYTPGTPRWLEEPNPEWPDNYKVKYWDRDWQRIIMGSPQSYLDRIIAAGFDGVYLDIIDSYEYFAEKGFKAARRKMEEFVIDIARYARAKGGADFGVFPQNGQELTTTPEYLAAITGVGREGTFYGHDEEGVATQEKATREIVRDLQRIAEAGKLVLNVDYVAEPAEVQRAYERAREQGFIEYCTRVELDRMVVNER